MTTLEDLQRKYKAGQLLNSDDMIALLQLQIDERGADFVYKNEYGRSGTGMGCYNVIYPLLPEGTPPIDGERDAAIRPYDLAEKPGVDWNAEPQKGCLIGSGLVDLVGGVNKVPRVGTAATVMKSLKVKATSKAKHIAATAQSYQDGGKTWGDALGKAIYEANEAYGDDENNVVDGRWSPFITDYPAKMSA